MIRLQRERVILIFISFQIPATSGQNLERELLSSLQKIAENFSRKEAVVQELKQSNVTVPPPNPQNNQAPEFSAKTPVPTQAEDSPQAAPAEAPTAEAAPAEAPAAATSTPESVAPAAPAATDQVDEQDSDSVPPSSRSAASAQSAALSLLKKRNNSKGSEGKSGHRPASLAAAARLASGASGSRGSQACIIS